MSSGTPGTKTPEIPVFDLLMEQEDLDAVAATLRSGWWTMGPRVAEFEAAFAEDLGSEHVVATANCTAALHLAMICAGVGPGDEVIVPAFTFVATAAAVVQAGGTPVFAEIVGQHDLGIDPASVEDLITERTKAVIAVHYAGYGAAVDRLSSLCRERGLVLVEDCAHSPGATLGGRKLGTFGFAGAFSFFSNKVLAVGEGGALVTDDAEVAARARLLRAQGMTAGTMDRHTGRATGYDVTALGYNYRLDEPRAALLLSRMKRLDAEIARRRELVSEYRRRLASLGRVIVPYRDEDVAESACYMMPVMVPEAGTRDEVRKALRARGVGTTVMYPGIHEFSAYHERYPRDSLPYTELASRTQITLPLFPHMSTDDVEYVVEQLGEVLS